MQLALIDAAGNRFKVAASVDAEDDDGFVVLLTSATTKNWLPGAYVWTEVFTDSDGERTTGRTGTFFVSENLIEGSPKSKNREIYENLLAKIQDRALPYKDIESSNINGQDITRMSSEQLMKWLNYFGAKVAVEVRRQRIATGQCSGRFTRLRA